ncbi:MAG: hypothetical protein ACR2PB_11170 [Desulfocapsaceae bacterium]
MNDRNVRQGNSNANHSRLTTRTAVEHIPLGRTAKDIDHVTADLIYYEQRKQQEKMKYQIVSMAAGRRLG